MNETLEATFSRIKEVFGIQLDPTPDNLLKLQQQEIKLDGIESAVANLVRPERITMNRNWNDIERMLEDIGSTQYRSKLLDSHGRPWVYNWFCLDHVGFTGENPRDRDTNHHGIFDRYKKYMQQEGWGSDGLHWHYHPLPYNGNLHGSGLAYLNSGNIWSIISRKVIERQWFPAAYRPGFHAERPDSHWFLEQWIPFDFANQSLGAGEVDTDQPDLAVGRWGDWRRAPNDWRVYHPSHDDYQVEGTCRRWIARCLNIEARLRVLSDTELERAFRRAESGIPTLVAFTNHDFRNMKAELDAFHTRISRLRQLYPHVPINFSEARTAIRSVLDLPVQVAGLSVQYDLSTNGESSRLQVRCEREIFGTQPYLAVKTTGGDFIWENFDYVNDREWRTVFDANHISPQVIEKIGIAVNSPAGVTEVIVLDRDGHAESHSVLGE